MRFGVHVSIGKGFEQAVTTAVALGCDGFQIFAGNPRGWARKPMSSQDVKAFRTARDRAKIYPVMVHLSYLPNLAAEDQTLFVKSLQAFREDYQRANLLGADFFVFHPGKSAHAHDKGLTQIVEAVNQTLEEVTGPTLLLFENQAGAGAELAADFQDLGRLIRGVQAQERVGICLDTCHAFAAGYDLRNRQGWKTVLSDFDSQVGLEFLKIFHLNDAMGGLGSHLDRHQHIGAGQIGLEGFAFLVNHPQLSQLPGILETPQNNPEDDLKNLATLRGLIV